MMWNDWDREFTFSVGNKKYLYQMERDGEEDNIKNFHYLFELHDDEVERLHLDWSPYGWPSKEELITWIECGQPSRSANGNANFNSESLAEWAYGYEREQ